MRRSWAQASMKFDRFPRQPFVGLTLAATIGIISAEILSGAAFHRLLSDVLFAFGTIPDLSRSRFRSTYPTVSIGFFLLHTFQIEGTPGLNLSQILGDQPRTVTAKGFVTDEPKPSTSGFE